MDTDTGRPTANQMGFNFSHVVSDIVDLVQLKPFQFARQNHLEAFADLIGQQLAIDEGIVGRRLHGGQVILPGGLLRGAHTSSRSGR